MLKRTLVLLPLIFMLFLGAASEAFAAPHGVDTWRSVHSANNAATHESSVKKKPKHAVLTIDNSTHASVPEDDGIILGNGNVSAFEVSFQVEITGALPGETYDVHTDMVDRCDSVSIVSLSEADAESGLGDIVVNFHGNRKFTIDGTNCVPNDNPNFNESDYWLSITGDGSSRTGASVGFEIVE